MNYHNTHEYLLDPQHKITVALIGCGGTGSQVLSILGRMNKSLVALEHPGLQVTVFDNDIVTEANVGRQLFSEAEIGASKAVSCVTRMNRFYGTDWEAVPKQFGMPGAESKFNIYITCVDEYKTRFDIAEIIRSFSTNSHVYQPLYWLDFGNTNSSGQAILGTLFEPTEGNIPMKCFDEWAKLYSKPKPSDNTPSCSLAEALEKQDLMINSTLANVGMQLLWRLFREGKTPYHGVMLNLDDVITNPIKI